MALVTNLNLEMLAKVFENYERKSLIANKTFTVRDLKVIYSEETPCLLIESYLNYLNAYLNLKDDSKLNAMQIRNIARQLGNILGNVTLGELWYFFNQIMSGHFGEFYGNIDPVKIAVWARQYMNERGAIITKDQNLRRHIEARNYKANSKLWAEYNELQYKNQVSFLQYLKTL